MGGTLSGRLPVVQWTAVKQSGKHHVAHVAMLPSCTLATVLAQ